MITERGALKTPQPAASPTGPAPIRGHAHTPASVFPLIRKQPGFAQDSFWSDPDAAPADSVLNRWKPPEVCGKPMRIVFLAKKIALPSTLHLWTIVISTTYRYRKDKIQRFQGIKKANRGLSAPDRRFLPAKTPEPGFCRRGVRMFAAFSHRSLSFRYTVRRSSTGMPLTSSSGGCVTIDPLNAHSQCNHPPPSPGDARTFPPHTRIHGDRRKSSTSFGTRTPSVGKGQECIPAPSERPFNAHSEKLVIWSTKRSISILSNFSE